MKISDLQSDMDNDYLMIKW